MILRWGIAAAGKISHDFVTALDTLSDDDHIVVAIAARDLERAKKFAELHKIGKFYGSYEDLAKDEDIDVVYVGAVHPQHFAVSALMIKHGKHVLCEKPLCMNEKQSKKLISFAVRKNVFLMEAIWSRFFPSYQYIKRQINSGILGDIVEVEASFGQNLLNVDRMVKKSLGGGNVLDLAVYVIQVCQWAFQGQIPREIHAKGELNSEGVDISMEAELVYSCGKGKIRTSAKEQLDNTAVIKGTKAQVTLKNFWCPTIITDIDGKEKSWALPEGKHETYFLNSIGLRYQAEEVRRCIQSGVIQSETVSHNESLIIARIEDEIRKQIGVNYEEDNMNDFKID